MIGVFDSGVGGLTVVRELRRLLPGKAMVYFGDTARTPYGNKSRDTVRRFAVEDAAFILSKGAKALVVACNTMSAVALDAIKERFPNVPVFDVITPAVEAVVRAKPGRVGVIGTRATVGSGVYAMRLKQLQSKITVIERACPLFVPLVEEGLADSPEARRVIRRYLDPVKHQKVDVLVLGCTHYPFLKTSIEHKMGKTCRVVDSAVVTAQQVARALSSQPVAAKEFPDGPLQLFFSDLAPHTEELARAWVPDAASIQHVPIEELEHSSSVEV